MTEVDAATETISRQGGETLGAPAAGESVCPALGLKHDPTTRFVAETPEHRCFAGRIAPAVPVDHQTVFCLTEKHARCPLWLESPRTAAMAAVASRRERLLHRAALAFGVLALTAAGAVGVYSFVFPHHASRQAAASLLPVPALASVTVPASAPPPAAAGASQQAVAAARASAAPQTTRQGAAGGQPSPTASPAPRASDLADDRLLRPGAELMARLNISLDGSAGGEAVVVSDSRSIDGCKHWFLDIYTYDPATARFGDVLDAGAKLTPEPAGSACSMQVQLLPVPISDGLTHPVAVATATLADGRVRVLGLGYSEAAHGVAITYDSTFPAGVHVEAAGDGTSVDVAPPASAAVTGDTVLRAGGGTLVETTSTAQWHREP